MPQIILFVALILMASCRNRDFVTNEISHENLPASMPSPENETEAIFLRCNACLSAVQVLLTRLAPVRTEFEKDPTKVKEYHLEGVVDNLCADEKEWYGLHHDTTRNVVGLEFLHNGENRDLLILRGQWITPLWEAECNKLMDFVDDRLLLWLRNNQFGDSIEMCPYCEKKYQILAPLREGATGHRAHCPNRIDTEKEQWDGQQRKSKVAGDHATAEKTETDADTHPNRESSTQPSKSTPPTKESSTPPVKKESSTPPTKEFSTPPGKKESIVESKPDETAPVKKVFKDEIRLTTMNDGTIRSTDDTTEHRKSEKKGNMNEMHSSFSSDDEEENELLMQEEQNEEL